MLTDRGPVARRIPSHSILAFDQRNPASLSVSPLVLLLTILTDSILLRYHTGDSYSESQDPRRPSPQTDFSVPVVEADVVLPSNTDLTMAHSESAISFSVQY